MKPKQWVPWVIRLGSVALVSVLTGQITMANVNHNDNQTAINDKGNVNGNQNNTGTQQGKHRGPGSRNGNDHNRDSFGTDPNTTDDGSTDSNGATIDDGLNGTDGYIGGDDSSTDPRQNFGSNNSQGSSGFTRPNQGGGNNTRTHGS